jgi:replicative DNA helicase
MYRLLSLEAGIELCKLKLKDDSPARWNCLMSAATTLAETNLYIEDSDVISPKFIYQTMSDLNFGKRDGRELVIVDYFQLLKCNHRVKSRQEEMTINCVELKAIATEFGVPMIVLAQLDRSDEFITTRSHLSRFYQSVTKTADQIAIIENGRSRLLIS